MRRNGSKSFDAYSLIGMHNVPPPVAAMGVCNPDRSPARVYRTRAASTPTGFAEIVGSYFPVLFHARLRLRKTLDEETQKGIETK
jgi:hypothetical protein